MDADLTPRSPRDAVEQFFSTLIQDARLLVAISGGSDSLGLLVSLAKFKPASSKVSIVAATVDHDLRAGSAAEARQVEDMCSQLSIQHSILKWQGEKPAAGISAAAREARYRLLMQAADEAGADAILTGHTLDDQMETVTMRAARNDAENIGLTGMAEAVLLERRRWLLRPFLMTRREDIRHVLSSEGYSWIDDPSNQNPRYERVRVRGSLSGQAQFDIGRWREAVAKRCQLSDTAALFVEKYVSLQHGVLARVDPLGFTETAAVIRHALASLAAILGGREFILPSHVMDRVMALLEGGRPGRLTAGRAIFDLRADGLFLMRENRGLHTVHVPAGETVIWDGRYRIANESGGEIIVGPAPPDRKDAAKLFPGAPPAIAMRAMGAMPFIQDVAPICPAGHLPHKGGDHTWFGAAPNDTFAISGNRLPQLISRLEGEMVGRPEGGETTSNLIYIHPTLGPYEHFLPQFEVNLAARFADLLGCDVFPRLPIKDSTRKS